MGDCWFLSAVAVLTDVSRISDVIITKEYSEEGIYTVRFCIQVNLQTLLLILLMVSSCQKQCAADTSGLDYIFPHTIHFNRKMKSLGRLHCMGSQDFCRQPDNTGNEL